MINNLIIRADASSRMGIGHIMRCIALAQAWQDQGGDVTFLSHCDSADLKQRIIDEGFEFINIERPCPNPNDLSFTLKMLLGISHKLSGASLWLALDGYHFTPDYQKAIKECGCRLLVIDDMAHLDHYHADILLNQNIHASSLHYSCDRETVKLLGCEYVLLRREFLKYEDWKREIPEKAKKILVTMGGSDPDNVTLKVLKAMNILDERELEVKIVVGPSNPNIERLKKELSLSVFGFELLASVKDMPELMSWADVAISAGGSTCWELAFMGLPNVVLVLAENQKSVAERLSKAEVAVNLGWHQEVSHFEVGHTIKQLIETAKIRQRMVRRGQALVDGQGFSRVLMHMNHRTVGLRKVNEKDCHLLWKWTNELDVRSASFTSESIPLGTHIHWLKSKLNNPNYIFYIINNGKGMPIGQIRYDLDGKEALVSISIDRRFRYQGYGNLAIRLSSEEIFRTSDVKRIHAYVKKNNKGSVEAFLKAGFTDARTEMIDGNRAVELVSVKDEIA